MKKYLAEMFGTMVLVLMGCGAAVSLGCTNGDPETVSVESLVVISIPPFPWAVS